MGCRRECSGTMSALSRSSCKQCKQARATNRVLMVRPNGSGCLLHGPSTTPTGEHGEEDPRSSPQDDGHAGADSRFSRERGEGDSEHTADEEGRLGLPKKTKRRKPTKKKMKKGAVRRHPASVPSDAAGDAAGREANDGRNAATGRVVDCRPVVHALRRRRNGAAQLDLRDRLPPRCETPAFEAHGSLVRERT